MEVTIVVTGETLTGLRCIRPGCGRRLIKGRYAFCRRCRPE